MVSQNVKLIILGVGLPTALGLLYYLLKTGVDDEDEDLGDREKSSSATSRQTVIEVPIPRKVVGAVIGRQGATIKQLQQESGTKINFKDDTQSEDADRTVVIRGTMESAQLAECLIRKIITDLPVIVQDQMLVPKYTLGRIIGRSGDSIRQMARCSKAKISIDRTRDCYHDKPQIITISGTREQILLARGLVQEKIDEEEELRATTAVAAANREMRKVPADKLLHEGKTQSANVEESSAAVNINGSSGQNAQEVDHQYCLEFPTHKAFVEVYVSAIANPGHFWVQTIGANALELDKLSKSMTRYYHGEGKTQTITSVKIGDIVAAPFENDDTWYRAKVMSMDDAQLDLFYVDYGDSAFMNVSLAKPICSEYMTLPYQAVECRLSGLKPNGEWTEEAFNKFESLTFCAKWKVINAKAVSFTGSIPHLVLVDTNNVQDININDEMVKCGYALTDT